MKHLIILPVFFVLSTLPLAAQEKTTRKPKGPLDLTPVKELPPGKVVSRQALGDQTTLARLANGLTVIVREHHVAPVATARVYVRNTGSAYEGQWLGAGISHLVEHLVSGGSTKNRGEKEIERLLTGLGASSNAYTSTDVTAYHIDTPARHIATAIEVLADAMQNCTFPEKEFNREYHVVQRELEMGEEERSRVMWNMLSELAYREHPLRHPVIGYLPVLQGLTLDDVLRFYRERYQPQNMIFVVVGDIQPDAILDQVSKCFATFKRTAELTIPMPVESPVNAPRSSRRQMEGELSSVAVAWPTVSIEHPDLYALDVASTILGSGDSSRLARKLRFEQQLVPSIAAGSHTPSGAPGWLQVSFQANPKNVEKARVEAIKEVMRLRTEPVTAAELAKAKKQTVAGLVFGRQSVEQLAESLSSGYRETGNPLFDFQYVERVQRVSAGDIQRVAQTYLLPERELFAVIDPLDVEKPKAAAAAHAEQGKTQKHRLPNGVTVLIQHNAAVPLVHLQCFVKAGLLGETDETNGVAGLTAELMTRGTQMYTGDQIAEYFDAVGGSIQASAGQHSNFVTCEVLKDDFVQAFDYFADVCLRPTFPAQEFADRKEEALLAIGQRKADTFGEASEFFHDQLPVGTALRRMRGGRRETVAKLTAEDCRRFHARYFAPENMVVTIFGDVGATKALGLVQQQFGAFKPAGNFKFPDVRGLSLEKSIQAHKTTRRPDTAVILLAYPSTTVNDHKENAALTVLEGILTGHDGGSGWLFNDLRGAGLVYVVQTSNRPTLVTGYFSVVAQTRPDQLPQALQRIKDNLAKAARGEITPEEFERSKRSIVNGHARENETLGERATLASIDELLGRGYDFEEGFEARIKAVTLAEVKAAAQRLFTKGVEITTGPGGK
jgi:zinc protease